MRDALVVAERWPKVAVEHALPVAEILLTKWRIETIEVAGGGDVGGWRAFAQHLLDGISGDQMNEQEDETTTSQITGRV